MVSAPTFATRGVAAPKGGASDLCPMAGTTSFSIKQDFYKFLSYMGNSATPELQIVADRATGGVNVPQVAVTERSDHSLEEKYDRRINRAICGPSDMDDTFIAHLQPYQSELRRNIISATPQDIGGCKISRDPNRTKSGHGLISPCYSCDLLFSGTNASKAKSAFGEELSLKGSDKGESMEKIGLKMHGKAQHLYMRPQADEFLYIDKFSPYFADFREQTLPSTSCRGAPSSSLCSQSQRKSSRLLSKRRKVCLDWDLLDWEFEKVEDVVLLDDEDLCGEMMDGSSDEWKEVRLYYPSRNVPESVALSYSDMDCLNPEQFLSSPVMNFYIQYLQRTEPTTCRPQVDYHIFNTFFFGKLEKALSQKGDISQCFLKLRRWWKGVNIFSKAYILLPIHGSAHWSLVIICNPLKGDDSGLLILHLDSLGLHSSQQISRIVSKFLKEEWNYMSQNSTADIPFRGHMLQHLPLRIDKKKVMVPQQKNKYDCGIFVLYFMKRFLEEAPQWLRKHDLSMFHAKWFKPAEASSLRKRIRDLLIEEFNKLNHHCDIS